MIHAKEKVKKGSGGVKSSLCPRATAVQTQACLACTLPSVTFRGNNGWTFCRMHPKRQRGVQELWSLDSLTLTRLTTACATAPTLVLVAPADEAGPNGDVCEHESTPVGTTGDCSCDCTYLFTGPTCGTCIPEAACKNGNPVWNEDSSSCDCDCPTRFEGATCAEQITCACKDTWDYQGSEYSGCQDALGDGMPWCYLKDSCPGATESGVNPGTFWIFCTSCEVGSDGES